MPAGEFLLATPEYPLPMARFTMPAPAQNLEILGSPVVFRSLEEGFRDVLELDRIDAWFLPFRPLEGVLRPGPGLRLQHMRLLDRE